MHRRRFEHRQLLISEVNLITRRVLLHEGEVTYLMTVTHFPLSSGW